MTNADGAPESAAPESAAPASAAQTAALASALDELAALGTDQDREQLAALRDRLGAARLRVLVAGEAKRGKSTLINALLGRAVLPAGVTPLTAVATTVRYGDDPHAQVRYADGHEEKQPLTALPELVTERGNPGNRRHVAEVIVYLDAPLLAGGVELVDTPGTGSVFAWDTAAAHEALRTMDAAVFVLAADPPVSAAERDLYATVTGLSVATFTVLNKADYLDAAGLAEAAEFTRQVLARAAGAAGRIYPLSARAALDGDDPGFAAFAADFAAYLAGSRVADLRLSAVAQARRIARSLLDEVTLTRRAARLTAGDAADRVTRFGDRLAEVAVRGRDAVAVAEAEAALLLRDLNAAAGADGRRLAGDVTRQLTEVLDGELRTAAPAEIERAGRDLLVALTVAAADAWRARRRDIIEQGLARTDTRLAADLTAALAGLRDSAAELLGLRLTVPEPGGRLATGRGFFYATAEATGQTELLAGAIRRSLPGEPGRRRAREHLLREAPDLVARQIGRARGDLQYRLAEATRALASSVRRRYAEATDRMRAALAAAEELRGVSAAAADEKERDLSEREVATLRALALLDEAAGERSQP